jgi:hypothetical protein
MKNKINKKRIIILSVLALLLAVITTGVVYGATWEYTYSISVKDTSAITRNYVPVSLGFNALNLVTSGKIDANGLDTAIEVSGTPIKYMLATNNTTAVLPILPGGGSIDTTLYTGYSPAQTGFSIILLDGGYLTVLDNEVLEITDTFDFVFTNIYIDTTAGAGKNIIYKNGACRLFVSDVVTGNITFEITGGASISALSLPTGHYDSLRVVSDSANVSIYVNTILKDSKVMTGDVPNTVNNWILFSGNTTMYVDSFTLER